ncbi:MAG: cell envelope integrity protein TolA, partial [Clostridia bacterium]|nr:cell envelope integrity protein TolA [Clostridia bacterium]
MEKVYLHDFVEKMRLDNSELCERFCHALRAGRNKTYHNVVSEAITLDDSWILTLESALFSVEKIVKNPRKFIIDEEILVDVAKARRTTSKTVRHLSSNSQYVQNITEEGEVRPKKLLTTEMDEDLAIYENRFVCALVQRLIPFVETRYNDIVSRQNSFDQTGVGMISNFRYGKNEVEVKLNVKVKEEPRNQVLLEKNNELIEKIRQLRKRLKILLNTEFIRTLSGKKPVHPPIMKTNLIKMNVDYNNCYKLWLYISSYTYVGFSVNYQEKSLPLDGDYYDDLTVIAAISVQSLVQNNLLNKRTYENIPFKKMKEKDFKLLTQYKFEPTFEADNSKPSEDIVNEYYFKRMRDELVRATKRNEYLDEKELKTSFARFCRGIAKINEEMYKDVITSQLPKAKGKLKKTPLQKKEEAVSRQKEYLKRYRQLSLIKREELEKILRLEARELLKLEKLQEALDKERGRQKNKRLAEKKQKERLEKISNQKVIAETNAKEYEQEIRDREAARIAAIEEEKRLKKEA